MISPQLQKFLEKDEEKLLRILRLFHLISSVNESIKASDQMKNSAMLQQLKIQKNGFVKELNEIMRSQYQLLVRA